MPIGAALLIFGAVNFPFQRTIAAWLCAALFLVGLPLPASAFVRPNGDSRACPPTTIEPGVSAPAEKIVEGGRLCGEQFDSALGQYYLRSRVMNPLTGRFWSIDLYEGSPDDPESLHKYSFVSNHPVEDKDPSGNDLLAASIGTEVHQIIGTHFENMRTPNGYSGRWISTILRLLPAGSLINTFASFTRIQYLPDLVDINLKEVYEIKPIGAANFALGEAQLAFYLKLLNAFDISGAWHAGDTYIPPLEFPIFTPIPGLVVVAPPINGVILYKFFKEYIQQRAKSVEEAEGAELEDEEGVATVNSLMGAP